MNNSSKNQKEFSNREEKIIKSTLMLCEDNKRKKSMLENLNSCIAKTEGLTCNEIVKSIKHVYSSIKHLYESSKHHLKQLSPRANQTEE